MQQVLGDSLGEDNIKFGHKVSKIEGGQQADSEITIHCQNDVTITADYVIGADGLWSKVRNFINPEPVAPMKGDLAFRGLATVDESVVPSNTHIRLMGRDTLFGVARVSETEVRWYCTSLEDVDENELTNPKAYLLDKLATWPSEVTKTVESTNLENFIMKRIMSFPPLHSWKKRPGYFAR